MIYFCYRNAEVVIERPNYRLVIPRSPVKSWKDVLVSPAPVTQMASKVGWVARATKGPTTWRTPVVHFEETLLSKAKNLQKLAEDLLEAAKQYRTIRFTWRSKDFLEQAKVADEAAAIAVAVVGTRPNAAALFIKKAEQLIKKAENAQKRASIENCAIIRGVGKKVMN